MNEALTTEQIELMRSLPRGGVVRAAIFSYNGTWGNMRPLVMWRCTQSYEHDGHGTSDVGTLVLTPAGETLLATLDAERQRLAERLGEIESLAVEKTASPYLRLTEITNRLVAIASELPGSTDG